MNLERQQLQDLDSVKRPMTAREWMNLNKRQPVFICSQNGALDHGKQTCYAEITAAGSLVTPLVRLRCLPEFLNWLQETVR